ncbi:unnamed protein product [Prunus armeniaca]
MAQIATWVQMIEDCVQKIIKSLSFVLTRGMEIDYPTLPSEKRIRIMALNYLMWNRDLVQKSKDELLLRSLGKEEYMKVMGEVHEGICGAHQGGRKMCWLIRRYDYFTKWVEAKPVKSTTSQEINTFIKEHIVHRFGIPESITTDKGTSFISREMLDMAEGLNIKLLQSTLYYAQANGQAEISNKVIINIIRKMLEENPRQWH